LSIFSKYSTWRSTILVKNLRMPMVQHFQKSQNYQISHHQANMETHTRVIVAVVVTVASSPKRKGKEWSL
jgi:hypothetical protein